MLTQRTFSELFTEMSEEESTPALTAGWETLLEPAFMTQLIAEMNGKNFQPACSAAWHRPRAAYVSQPRRARPHHTLSEIEQSAYKLLSFYKDGGLHPGFNLHELKSAYRAALLKTHPDQGGSAETFQQVKKSYEILSAFVTNKA